jgi:hypothetical protein
MNNFLVIYVYLEAYLLLAQLLASNQYFPKWCEPQLKVTD